MTLVAKLTYDHLDKRKGNLEFTYEALYRFWGGQNFGTPPDELSAEEMLDTMDRTEFKLYDDDNELYYTGWLKDDDEALVQQFVLAWAMADSGCTTIKVKVDGEWVQIIG